MFIGGKRVVQRREAHVHRREARCSAEGSALFSRGKRIIQRREERYSAKGSTFYSRKKYIIQQRKRIVQENEALGTGEGEARYLSPIVGHKPWVYGNSKRNGRGGGKGPPAVGRGGQEDGRGASGGLFKANGFDGGYKKE